MYLLIAKSKGKRRTADKVFPHLAFVLTCLKRKPYITNAKTLRYFIGFLNNLSDNCI